MKRLLTLIGFALAALGLLGVSSAATIPLAGTLDPSFGSGGVVTQTHGFVGAIAVQPDGKVIAAGDDAGSALIARYLTNGSLDSSFGQGGYVKNNLPPPTNFAGAAAVAVQPDGKIVVAGTSTPPRTGNVGAELTLLRYDANGSLDTSFGAGGSTTTVIPEPGHKNWDAVAAALAVLPDGDLLVAGSASWTDGANLSSSFALARYTPEGALDLDVRQGRDRANSVRQSKRPTRRDRRPAGRQDRRQRIGLRLGSRQRLQHDRACALQAERFARFHLRNRGEGDDRTRARLSKVDRRLSRAARSWSQASTTRSCRCSPATGRTVASTRPSAITASRPSRGRSSRRRRLPFSRRRTGRILLDLPGSTGGTEALDALVRFTSSGRVDPSFGTAGVALLPSSGSTALDVESDGNVLVGGGIDGSMLVRVLGGNNCVVPGLLGKTVSNARAALRTSYCGTGSISRLFSNKVARGRVISTAPLRGGRLPRGTKVALVVSRGRRG